MTAVLMNDLLIASATGTAIALFATAMPRHHETLFGKPPARARREILKFSAWLMLAVSLLIAASSGRDGIALVAWFALLSAHGVAVSLLITFAPRVVASWGALCAACLALVAVLRLAG